MNGHDLCATYLAVKLHFTNEKYNFFLGSGKAKIGVDAFQKRRDKYMFHKLARKLSDDEVVPFLVANFINDGETWTRSLLEDESQKTYTEWKRKVESLSYIFENDLVKLLETDNDELPKHKVLEQKFTSNDGDYPEVLQMYMQKDISLETMVIFNNLMGCFKRWDRELSDTVIYPKIAMRVRKYGSFLSLDLDKMKGIVKKHLTKE
jgi:hypothetical protein